MVTQSTPFSLALNRVFQTSSPQNNGKRSQLLWTYRTSLSNSIHPFVAPDIPIWLLWLPVTLVHVRGEEKWGGEEGVGIDQFEGRGWKCWLRGNGATQSETCYTICKRGWVVIGHERFENSGSVLGRHLGFCSLDYRGYRGGRRSFTP